MSELDLYAKYLDLGARLGRSGEDLAAWVEDKDEALSIFLSLSPAEGADYQAVKRVLLRRFGCDRNGFRSKFLSVKPQDAEDFGTFINRAKRYFDRWVELSGVTTLEGLSYLVCSEIALQACDEDFVAYVKDRSPSDMVSLKTVASAYIAQGPINLSDRSESDFNSGNVSGGQRFGPSSSSGSGLAASRSDVTCYQCGGKGHVRRECPSRPKDANSAYSAPKLPSHCCAAKMGCDLRGRLKIESCKVFDRVSTLLRDSGCNTVGVCKSLVPPDCYTGRSLLVNTFFCKNKLFPTCIINIQTPHFSGDVEACLLDHPIADVILGNINGLSSESRLSFDSDSTAVFPDSSIACVVTRAQASKASVGNELPISDTPTHFDVLAPFSDLPVRQREDPSLAPWFKRVGLPPVDGVSFRIEDGVLKRLHARSEFATVQTTIAVPESLRQIVLSYAHESDLAGHSGFRKTLSAIRTHFSWPGVCSDIKNYTTSCHMCQIKPRTGRDLPAPFQPVPIVGEPFERVIIDLVGPLPLSSDRYEYLLTLVDVSTRWAEAVPLRRITAKDVAESLFSIFVRLGFPKEIQSDRGQQFISTLLAEFNSMCNIKHFVSTPYHPQTNGIVERFHSSLKSMIRKLSHEFPTEWNRFVRAALFAYRGQVHSSTGFSPFFLLFGRAPRDPMQILSDVFLNKDLSGETSFQYHYVLDLHNRIRKGWRLAQDSVRDSVDESRFRHEPKSKLKHFVPGDEVLVLLPTSDNKLVLSYKGPYKVVEKRTSVVYLVDLDDRKCTFHVNLLRKYKRSTYPPPPSDNLVGVDSACSSQAFAGATSFCGSSVFPFSSHSTVEPSLSVNTVIDENLDPNHDSNLKFCETICFAEPTAYEEDGDEIGSLVTTPPLASESGTVVIDPSLSASQVQDVKELLIEFQDILTSVPGCTNTLCHEIRLTTDDVIRVKPYPLPFASREFVTQEVNDLLSLGVIEPSDSPYCFPIVVVKKKDVSMRLCIDFRKLNAVTVFDAENIPRQEDLKTFLVKRICLISCPMLRSSRVVIYARPIGRSLCHTVPAILDF
ncbi:gypsy retrotransposon integrase-like protein 1 [Plakobranchus ocellatus]|uniref:Gypsy retrotransposon integrase-like protein 1 n=1 Tax=Plakobranchus ocellatus TaxID=259542 RepID=A0AAV4CVV7_9GAST|nr:gypsy retrotransposon integrase-like protein 1 [Plakobranchus ocellatus]